MIQGRWIEKVNGLEGRGSSPTFGDLVLCVVRQAKKGSHPIYRVASRAPPPKKEIKPNQRASTVLHAHQGPERALTYHQQQNARSNRSIKQDSRNACAHCTLKGHDIGRYRTFIQKSLAERKDFVYQHRLCFNYIGNTHDDNTKATCIAV